MKMSIDISGPAVPTDFAIEVSGAWSVAAQRVGAKRAVADVVHENVHERRVRARRETRDGVPGWAYYGTKGMPKRIREMVYKAIERL